MSELKVIYHSSTEKMHGRQKYHDDRALRAVIQYCLNPEKTPHKYIGAYGVNINQAALEMKLLADAYCKDRGLRLRHFILTLSPDEVKKLHEQGKNAEKELFTLADYIARYYGNEYQIIFAVHESEWHPHIHFVMNTVNFKTGKKYGGQKKDYYDFQSYIGSYLFARYGFYLRTIQCD